MAFAFLASYVLLFLVGNNFQSCNALRCMWDVLYEVFAEAPKRALYVKSEDTTACGKCVTSFEKSSSRAEYYYRRQRKKTISAKQLFNHSELVIHEDMRTKKTEGNLHMANASSFAKKTEQEDLMPIPSIAADVSSTVQEAEQEGVKPLQPLVQTQIGELIWQIIIALGAATVVVGVYWCFRRATQRSDVARRQRLEEVTQEEAELVEELDRENQAHVEVASNNATPSADQTYYRQLHSKDEIMEHVLTVAAEVNNRTDVSQDTKDMLTFEFLDDLAVFITNDWSMNRDLHFMTPELLAKMAEKYASMIRRKNQAAQRVDFFFDASFNHRRNHHVEKISLSSGASGSSRSIPIVSESSTPTTPSE